MSQQVENQKQKICFCISDANNANAFASLEAWQNYCEKQKKIGLLPSPLALQKAQLESWWPECIAQKAA